MLLTCQQCRQFDRIAIVEFGMPGIALMENAGAACAREIIRRYRDGHVCILAGSGNNGGDGFVIARHLSNVGVPVVLVKLAADEKIIGDALTNLEILRLASFDIVEADESWTVDRVLAAIRSDGREPSIVVDAMLGTGAKGSPRPPFREAIEAVNGLDCVRIAIDIPTGFDGDSGSVASAAFEADVTLTFVARKVGFEVDGAQRWLGAVEVIDIGAPRQVFDRLD